MDPDEEQDVRDGKIVFTGISIVNSVLICLVLRNFKVIK